MLGQVQSWKDVGVPVGHEAGVVSKAEAARLWGGLLPLHVFRSKLDISRGGGL